MSMQSTKTHIRSLVTSSGLKTAYTTNELIADYLDIVGTPLPLHNFRSYQQMLESLTDTIILHGQWPNQTIELVSSSQSSHIENLVLGQKDNKRSRGSSRFPLRRPFRSIQESQVSRLHVKSRIKKVYAKNIRNHQVEKPIPSLLSLTNVENGASNSFPIDPSLEDTKLYIRGLVTSAPLKTAYTIKQLIVDFDCIVGHPMPLHGFQNYKFLLESLADTITLCGQWPNQTVQLVSSNQSYHVEKLVLEQKERQDRTKTRQPLHSRDFSNEINHHPASFNQDYNCGWRPSDRHSSLTRSSNDLLQWPNQPYFGSEFHKGFEPYFRSDFYKGFVVGLAARGDNRCQLGEPYYRPTASSFPQPSNAMVDKEILIFGDNNVRGLKFEGIKHHVFSWTEFKLCRLWSREILHIVGESPAKSVIVIIHFGTFNLDSRDSRFRQEPCAYYNEMAKLLDLLLYMPGCSIVVSGILPLANCVFKKWAAAQRDDLLQNLCNGYGLNVHFASNYRAFLRKDARGEFTVNGDLFEKDNIHLNEHGSQKLSSILTMAMVHAGFL